MHVIVDQHHPANKEQREQTSAIGCDSWWQSGSKVKEDTYPALTVLPVLMTLFAHGPWQSPWILRGEISRDSWTHLCSLLNHLLRGLQVSQAFAGPSCRGREESERREERGMGGERR